MYVINNLSIIPLWIVYHFFNHRFIFFSISLIALDIFHILERKKEQEMAEEKGGEGLIKYNRIIVIINELLLITSFTLRKIILKQTRESETLITNLNL